MEHVIIFCQTYNDVTHIFYMKSKLKGEMPWAPDGEEQVFLTCSHYSATKEAIVWCL